jgi:acetyl esterase/lipase
LSDLAVNDDDEWPALRVPERVIPMPTSISEAARRYLQSQRFPAQIHPEVGDAAAWIARRRIMDQAMLDRLRPITAGALVSVRELAVGPASVYEVIPSGAGGERVYLELHGGGLTMGGGECCRLFAVQRAAIVGETVWAADYRMPPEHPYPAALDDCLAAYRTLLERVRPDHVVIGGGSAGGNLAAATVLRARDQGLPLPAAIVLVSPEVDLTESGDTFRTNLGVDTVLQEPLMRANLLYANGHDLTDPYVSPLFGDFTRGFCPTFIVSGTRDLFLSNAVRLHRALCRADVPTELHVFEAAPHGMPLRVGTPEEADFNRELHKFLAAHW